MGQMCSGIPVVGGAPKAEIDAKQMKEIQKAVKDAVNGAGDLKAIYDYLFNYKKENNADWDVDKLHSEVLEDDSKYPDSGVAQDVTTVFDQTVGAIADVVGVVLVPELVAQMDANGGEKVPEKIKEASAEKVVEAACKKQLDKYLEEARGKLIFAGEEPTDE